MSHMLVIIHDIVKYVVFARVYICM